MKKALILLLSILFLLSAASGCGAKNAVKDGRARPSSCGKLQVIDGKLCDQNGDPVMLRGVSTHDLITTESFINDDLFRELSEEYGVNVVRLAVYTYGMGVIGYCAKGDRERYQKNIANGVAYAKAHDMYAIIDWHVLSDGDPNRYLDDAKTFFAEMAEQYCDQNNVLYEICNEPNGVDWATVKRYAEEIIPIIRGKDPDAVILVGNPDWSKDLRSVAADPLPYGNIMYTLHFYAATHGQEYRDMLAEMRSAGLPVFVTEYGVIDRAKPEDAVAWFRMIHTAFEKYGIGRAAWSYREMDFGLSDARMDVVREELLRYL